MSNWLVDDWRECRQWLSMQLSVLAGILSVAFEFVPGLNGVISDKAYRVIMIGMIILIVLGRLVKQKK